MALPFATDFGAITPSRALRADRPRPPGGLVVPHTRGRRPVRVRRRRPGGHGRGDGPRPRGRSPHPARLTTVVAEQPRQTGRRIGWRRRIVVAILAGAIWIAIGRSRAAAVARRATRPWPQTSATRRSTPRCAEACRLPTRCSSRPTPSPVPRHDPTSSDTGQRSRSLSWACPAMCGFDCSSMPVATGAASSTVERRSSRRGRWPRAYCSAVASGEGHCCSHGTGRSSHRRPGVSATSGAAQPSSAVPAPRGSHRGRPRRSGTRPTAPPTVRPGTSRPSAARRTYTSRASATSSTRTTGSRDTSSGTAIATPGRSGASCPCSASERRTPSRVSVGVGRIVVQRVDREPEVLRVERDRPVDIRDREDAADAADREGGHDPS